MLKNVLIAIVFFGAGFVFAKFFYGDTPSVANSNPIAATEFAFGSVVKTDDSEATDDIFSNRSEVTPAPAKLNPKTLPNPETAYDAFRLLIAIDPYSAEELKDLLVNISKDKKELRQQIVFFLVGKYPQESFVLLSDALNQNDSYFAKYILQSSAQSHPLIAWQWMQKNGSDFDKLYGPGDAKKNFKMQVLTTLSSKPEHKLLVTEEIQRMAQEGSNARENYFLETINKNIANSDPEGSVNAALASSGGKVDKDLFKGGVLAIADKDLARAKDLVLQHPEFVDESLIQKISSKLVENNQFSDVNVLVGKLTDPSMLRSVTSGLAYEISQQGVKRSIEFINAVDSEELKLSTVMAVSNYMSSNGQPVKEQLAIFDEALKNIPVDKKAFNYAYTINNWSKKDAPASAHYLAELASSNKPLSDEVQIILARLKR